MIVLTTLLTSTPDPQRGTKWECDPMLVESLARSCWKFGHVLTVLHDEEPLVEPLGSRWVKVERKHSNPYFDRWRLYADFVETKGWIGEWVWCVDATDVEMLRDAFPMSGGVLKVGSEPGSIAAGPGADWLHANHALAFGLAKADPDLMIYNAGILGGPPRDVVRVGRSMWRLLEYSGSEQTDMAAFNVVMHSWPEAQHTGPEVHTRFRAEESEHPTAIWRHK